MKQAFRLDDEMGNDQAWPLIVSQLSAYARSASGFELPTPCSATADFQTCQNAGKIGRGGGIRTPDPLLPKQEPVHSHDICCKRMKHGISLLMRWL